MRKHMIGAFLIVAAIASAGSAIRAQNPSAPPPPPTWTPDIKFASGREIVPYLEGWIKNPDGSFDFVFGYYSRNQQQEMSIPAGPDNSVMPGGPDRGQPTYFTARRQNRIYRVRVPKDWGDKTLTWSITANGRTEKVVAKMVPAYEKDEYFITSDNRTTIQFGVDDVNKAPTISVPANLTASVGTPLTLTADVADDGLPAPRPAAVPKPIDPTDEDARFRSQRNNAGGGRPAVTGTRVSWLPYRGPAKVTFGSLPVQVANGKAVTTANFTAPGTYVLIATVNDTRLSSRTQVTVTVK